MVIGITGSIACGKSIVSNYLEEQGYKVIDCDKISHQVISNQEVINEIRNVFGNNVIKNNYVDRKSLASIVFESKDKKTKLENIMIDRIINIVKDEINKSGGLTFLDAPTLIENNLLYLVDKLIVIVSKEKTIINRLMKRDSINQDYAIKKIKSQLDIKEKVKYADYIINNDSTIVALKKEVDKVLKQIKMENEYEN